MKNEFWLSHSFPTDYQIEAAEELGFEISRELLGFGVQLAHDPRETIQDMETTESIISNLMGSGDDEFQAIFGDEETLREIMPVFPCYAWKRSTFQQIDL